VVRGKHHQNLVHADLAIQRGEEALQHPIGAQHHIHHFMAVGSKAVPHQIISGEPERQQIGILVPAEPFLLDGFDGNIEQHLVLER
jgi:hypothetical protein